MQHPGVLQTGQSRSGKLSLNVPAHASCKLPVASCNIPIHPATHHLGTGRELGQANFSCSVVDRFKATIFVPVAD